MFRVTRSAPDRVDIEYSGKLERDEMIAALDELLANTEGLEHARMLVRVGEFVVPSLSALGAELSRVPSLLGFLRKFDRCALLTDYPWLRTIAELEGTVVPGVVIKGFALADTDAAETWLAER